MIEWLLLPRKRQLLSMIGGSIVALVSLLGAIYCVVHLVGCFPKYNP